MKKILLVLFAFGLVFGFNFNAEAQMLTEDLIFLKLGYIPVYSITTEEKEGNKEESEAELSGFAIQAEYNIVVASGFWLGVGMEYQRVTGEEDIKELQDGKVKYTAQFIQPMVSIKMAAAGGLYLGAGLSGKYCLSVDTTDEKADLDENSSYETLEIDMDKEFDLWGNAILGFYTAIGEGVYLNIEARFGYNFTKKQFEKGTLKSVEIPVGSSYSKLEENGVNTYDMAFYIGVAYNATGGGGF